MIRSPLKNNENHDFEHATFIADKVHLRIRFTFFISLQRKLDTIGKKFTHVLPQCDNYKNLLSQFFSKIVKPTSLVKKLPKSWFHEIFFWWEFTIFPQMLREINSVELQEIHSLTTVHSVEITRIHSRAFLAKISWK